LNFVDPKLVKEFFNKQDHYVKARSRLGLAPYLQGNGLALSEGEEWKRQRKFISQVFHYEYLNDNVPLIAETVNEFLTKLLAGDNTSVILLPEFSKITGGVIGKMFFGEDLNKYEFEGENLLVATATLIRDMSASSGLFSLLFGIFVSMAILPKHKRMINRIMRFRSFCEGLIIERKKNFNIEKIKTQKRKDLLDLLLEKNFELGEEVFSTPAIIDQFITFFIAGMDTTAQTAAMAMYYMAAYPDSREKIELEMKKFYKSPQEAKLSEIQKMEYLEAFLKELLRVASPVPGLLLREAVDDHEIGSIKVKKGTLVNIGTIINNSNPKYFDNPEKFEPERFLDWNKGEQKFDPFVFTPFSAGARNCIGQHLAMVEMKVIMCEFLRLFNFKLVDGYQLKMTIKLSYTPVEPVTMNLRLKNE